MAMLPPRKETWKKNKYLTIATCMDWCHLGLAV